MRGRDGWLRALDLAAVLAVGAGLAAAFSAVGVPSPSLFAGLAVGLFRALTVRRRATVPAPVGTAVQAVLGVMVGTLLDLETLAALARDWSAVALVIAGTLALSLVAGRVMALRPDVSPVTGAFSMVAGGASGITVMARELGADERMVAVLQYLRVLIVVLTLPAVTVLVFSADSGDGTVGVAGDRPAWWVELGFTAGCAVVGAMAAKLLRIPVASMLGPMLVAGGLALGGLSGGAQVPNLLVEVSFLVIGLQVGLGFTRTSLRIVGSALPLAVSVLIAMIVACAGLGLLLTVATGVGFLEGYLATTPGGLYAVIAAASAAGADTTFVLAVQVLRLFVVLLSAPLIAWFLRRSDG